MAPDAGLRPPALVVAAGDLVGAVSDLYQVSRMQAVEPALLSADHGNERAVGPADERHQRRKVELGAHADGVGHALRKRQHAPEGVEPGGEHRHARGAVAVELALEVVLQALEVGQQRLPALVSETCASVSLGLRALVEECVDARPDIADVRSDARAQIDVEADHATPGCPHRRQLTKDVPADRGRCHSPLRTSILPRSDDPEAGRGTPEASAALSRLGRDMRPRD